MTAEETWTGAARAEGGTGTGGAPARSDGTTLPRVRAVSRAVAILRAFTPEQPQLALGVIAARAGLDAGTTRRLLVTLRDEGLVAQDASSGQYRLTMEVLRLGAAVQGAGTLRDVAGPVMDALASETGSTVFLSTWQGGEAMCVLRRHGPAPVQVNWWAEGAALPVNVGAAPRLLLAFRPPAERAAALSRGLSRLTERSVTEAAVLDAELAEIRDRGWCFAADDVALGLAALAVPVRDRSGQVLAALSLAGLTAAFSGPQGKPRVEMLEALRARARELSARMPSENFIL